MAQLIVKSSSFNDIIITGPNFTGSGNLIMTGSLRLTGSLNISSLTNPSSTVSTLLIISSSGQVFSTASTAYLAKPTGSNGTIQFNNSGQFGAVSGIEINLTPDGRGGYNPSLVLGPSNLSNGYFSVAQGSQNTASGIYAHAEGQNTEAIGNSSHTEGSFTKTYGDYSHAEGDHTETHINAGYSHASGRYTVTSASYQIATGQFNKHNNTSDYFVIGVGSFGGRADGFGINNTRTYISNSIYLPNISNLTAQNNLITYDASTGQLWYTSTSSIKVVSSSYALTASYVAGSTSPGGSNGSIQYNSGSIFTGSSILVLDENNNFLFNGGTMGGYPDNSNNGNYGITLIGAGLTGNVYSPSLSEGDVIVGKYNTPIDTVTNSIYPSFTVGNGDVSNGTANAIEVGLDTLFTPYINLPQLSYNAVPSSIVSYGNGGQLGYTTYQYPHGTPNSIQFNNNGIFGEVSGFNYVGGELQRTGSFTITEALKLRPSNPLPTGQLGSLATSGSKLWFHNGSTWKEVSLL